MTVNEISVDILLIHVEEIFERLLSDGLTIFWISHDALAGTRSVSVDWLKTMQQYTNLIFKVTVEIFSYNYRN